MALMAFLLNLALALVKGYLAQQSSSLAITAGAIDSATDSIASLAVFGCLLTSTRKTRTFPLGLYKIENLISVVISLFIFFAGFEIAVRVLQPPAETPDISMPMLWWILGCTAATFFFGKYALYLGRKTESPALLAEGRHRQVDVLSSLVVLISVSLNYYQVDLRYGFLTVDRIAALLVLIFIIKAGWELLSDGMRVLLDASVDYETLERARKIIEKEPAVKEVTALVGRNAGRFRFISAEVTLRILDFKKAHQIADRVEKQIREQIPHMERVELRYAPTESKIRRVAFPVLEDGDTISEHFGEAPQFLICQINTETGEIERKVILENPHGKEQKGKGILAARFLVNQNIDMLGARKKMEQSGPSYVFSDAGIETFQVSGNTATEALKVFLP
jgi:cation diffusion facilitator family transporter